MIDWGHVDRAAMHPVFSQDIHALLLASPFAWKVTYGYRSLAEQSALYAIYQQGGPKAAPAGKSAHNFGLAVDLALDGSPAPGLQPDWNTSHAGWAWLRTVVNAHPRLRGGWHFGDGDHVQAVNWLGLRGWQQP